MNIKFSLIAIDELGNSCCTYEFDGNTLETHEKVRVAVEGDARLLRPGTSLTVKVDGPPEDVKLVLLNYRAVLVKGWKFIFPGCESPRNPWISGVEHESTSRMHTTDELVEFALNHSHGDLDPAVLRALVWKLTNALEWCTLPDRKKLTGRSTFTRNTWEEIAINKNPSVLKKEAVMRQVLPEQEPIVPAPTSDHAAHESDDCAQDPVDEA